MLYCMLLGEVAQLSDGSLLVLRSQYTLFDGENVEKNPLPRLPSLHAVFY